MREIHTTSPYSLFPQTTKDQIMTTKKKAIINARRNAKAAVGKVRNVQRKLSHAQMEAQIALLEEQIALLKGEGGAERNVPVPPAQMPVPPAQSASATSANASATSANASATSANAQWFWRANAFRRNASLGRKNACLQEPLHPLGMHPPPQRTHSSRNAKDFYGALSFYRAMHP